MKIEKFLTLSRSHRPILNEINVLDNFAYSTDLELFVKVKSSLTDGLYKLKGIDQFAFKSDMDQNDFPDINHHFDHDENNYFEISRDHLESLLSHCSKDETRIYLNGIFLDVQNKNIISTDGYGLFCVNADKFDGQFQLSKSLIIPRSFIKKLLSITSKKETSFKLFITDDFIIYKKDNSLALSGRLIQREYPKYLNVFPTKKKASFPLNVTKHFKTLIENILTKEKILKLKETEKFLEFNVSSLGLNIKHQDEIIYNCNSINSDVNTDIKFMLMTDLFYRFILNINEVVNVDFNADLHPILIKNKDYMTVIMPFKGITKTKDVRNVDDKT